MTEFFDFIAEENPGAARRVVQDLLDRIEVLADHPRLGRRLFDEVDPELRRLVAGDYIVVYRIIETRKEISIVAVRHSRQRSLPGEE